MFFFSDQYILFIFFCGPDVDCFAGVAFSVTAVVVFSVASTLGGDSSSLLPRRLESSESDKLSLLTLSKIITSLSPVSLATLLML